MRWLMSWLEEGSRLMELTTWRVKPAVYFGGKSRIIDFALSNAFNSGIRHIAVATQYKAHSADPALVRRAGTSCARSATKASTLCRPASAIREDCWYHGTADAVDQNIDIIESYSAGHVVVLAGDHVYKMDYELMLQQHVAQRRGRHGGLPRSPARGGNRLWRHGHRRSGRDPQLHREAGRPAWNARASPNSRSPPWASMCSTWTS